MQPSTGRRVSGAIYINGRYAAQPVTGVQRAAHELVRAMDSLPQLLLGPRCVLLLPPGVDPPPLRHIEVRHVGSTRTPHHLWEQTTLPLAARTGTLLGLAGGTPWRARHQAVVLHDAAVFDHPEAYTRPYVWWYRRLSRHLARHAARIWTVSEFSRTRLALHLGLDPRSIGLLPPLGADHILGVPAEPTVLARLGLVPGRFLLAVASENPTKNHAALLQAFAQLPMRGAAQLVLVGRSNLRVFSSRSAASEPRGVVRAGPVRDGELRALYEQAAALIVPSLYEGFGLPAAEAMTCGCPVAAARAASLPEVCGDAAFYFDPRSPQDITAAMQRMLTDTALRAALIRASVERAVHFRWENAARRLLVDLQAGAAS